MGRRATGWHLSGNVRVGPVRVLGVSAVLPAALERYAWRQCGKLPLRQLLPERAATVHCDLREPCVPVLSADRAGEAAKPTAVKLWLAALGQRAAARRGSTRYGTAAVRRAVVLLMPSISFTNTLLFLRQIALKALSERLSKTTDSSRQNTVPKSFPQTTGKHHHHHHHHGQHHHGGHGHSHGHHHQQQQPQFGGLPPFTGFPMTVDRPAIALPPPPTSSSSGGKQLPAAPLPVASSQLGTASLPSPGPVEGLPKSPSVSSNLINLDATNVVSSSGSSTGGGPTTSTM